MISECVVPYGKDSNPSKTFEYLYSGVGNFSLSDNYDEVDTALNHNYPPEVTHAVDTYVSRLYFGSGRLLIQHLEKTIHVGPLREIPNRRYEPDQTKKETNWYNGLGAWDQLYFGDEELKRKTNKWFEKLKIGYQIEHFNAQGTDSLLDILLEINSPYEPSEKDDRIEYEEKEKALREKLVKVLPPFLNEIYLIDSHNGTRLKPQDIGVGISQVLPIVLSAVVDQQCPIIIEQPELHIHPSFQVELGDLFISEIFYKDSIESKKPERIEGKLFLIETHSEHLILRFMRRLYETSNDEIENNGIPLSPSDITVYFIEPNGEGAKITELPLDEEGEFKKNWPKGFFTERSEELQ